MEQSWKQEVSRRIAAHKNRKGGDPAEKPTQASHPLGSSRAAAAAARVAARYSKAPSYSQLQAEEARVAVRAAEIATQVALEAQAVAEDALAELHAAAETPMRGPAVVESITRAARSDGAPLASAMEALASVSDEAVEAPDLFSSAGPVDTAAMPSEISSAELRPVTIRWEPDIPIRVLEPKPAPRQELEFAAEDWWTPARVSDTLRSEPIAVNPEPAHANLIEFPREIVATRRMRPRLAETPLESRPTGEAQLSIFEVDPGAISTEPQAAAADHSPWTGPEWSGIELDEHPADDLVQKAEAAAAAPRIFLAPLGLRLMAAAVDTALILSAFSASAILLASRLAHLPMGKPAEFLALGGLVFAGLIYNAIFFALGFSTPGMRYAGIALSTFDHESPTRAEMRRRFGATVLSLAPVGLGFAWSIFDEDHLTWHDRISQTYLRKR